ncbi:MAG: hypothetical protein IPJ69_10345 [Deltaproteobacteria bacterium]|nr:MAG: hypothetical protein IPJ69_10345 [Deltaproteobacteria bacterium]
MSSNVNLNTNIQQSLYSVQKSQKKLNSTFEKLSTGKKINKSADDVVGMSKAVSLETVSRGIEAVSQYASFRNSELGISQGSLGQNLEDLQKARELSVRGAGDDLSSAERDVLSTQLSDLGVHGVDFSSSASSASSLTALDASIQSMGIHLSQLGSESNTIDFQEQANQSQQEQIESARSRIEDADIAQIVSRQVQDQLRLGASIQVLHKSQQVSAIQALGLIS